MKKELTKRIIDGFSYAAAINVVVALICILVFKEEPLRGELFCLNRQNWAFFCKAYCIFF